MPTLLAKNADVLVTMDGARRELKECRQSMPKMASSRKSDPTQSSPPPPIRLSTSSGQILLPGFVNTHHHLNQTLTRNLPAGQNNNLFPWLKAHLPRVGAHRRRKPRAPAR